MPESKSGERSRLLVIEREWTEAEKEFYRYSPTPRKKKKETNSANSQVQTSRHVKM